MAATSTTGLLALMSIAVLLTSMASHGGASGDDGCLDVPPPEAEPAPRATAGDALVDCMAVLLEKMSPCAAYVEAGSNLAAPGRECCMGLAAVAGGAPQCLCALMNAADGELYGIRIDRDRARELPGVCMVAVPPLDSMCSAPSPSPGASFSCHDHHRKCNGVVPGLGSPALALLAGLAVAAVRFF